MIKKLIIFLWVLLTVFSFEFAANASELNLSAHAAVLICVNNGEVLYIRNGDEKLSMASTTKIMTSLLALEYPEPDKEIIVTDEMVMVEGTSMGLAAGDSVSLRELVYGMLLQSGNDAANTVAYVIGGSKEQFAVIMNDRAKQIGMNNTNFVTPSGLDDDEHYSTAYDMALLACECMKNPEFAYICSQKRASLTYGNPPYLRTLTNHNKLLQTYKYSVGIKTGFTKKSGRCLVSAAEKDGITLVAVTLRAPDDWNDHISLFEYGFSKCKGSEYSCELNGININVAGGVKQQIPVTLSETVRWLSGDDVTVSIRLKPLVYAPVRVGDIVGKAVFGSENRDIAEVFIHAGENVEIKPTPELNDNNKENLLEKLVDKLKDFFNVSEVK